jgi:hypothetical protein
MATENPTGYEAFIASSAASIGLGIRVKIDSAGEVSAAGVSDAWIGTADTPISAGRAGTVKLLSAPGSRYLVSSGAIDTGDDLYCAADGKVSSDESAGTHTGFVAITSATSTGTVIEAAPRNPGSASATTAGLVTLNAILTRAAGAPTWTSSSSLLYWDSTGNSLYLNTGSAFQILLTL